MSDNVTNGQINLTNNSKRRSEVSDNEFNGLKANRDEILSEKKALMKRNEELSAQIGELGVQLDAANKKFDEYHAGVSAEWIERTTAAMAAEISNAPKIFRQFIESRLRVDVENGRPVMKVLNLEGNATTMSVDDLRKEFYENPDYAPILRGSRATGSGASGGGGGLSARHVESRSSTVQEPRFGLR